MKKITKILVLIFLLIFLIYESYLIYNIIPKEEAPLSMISQGYNNLSKLEKFNQSAVQFSPNMRFNHNTITYKIDNNCPKDTKENMLLAFLTLTKKVEIIKFLEKDIEPDISISCSEEVIKNDEFIFIAGEGGPSKYINSTIYPVILKGKILLYDKSKCDSPIVEIHELLHVFGFDHSQDRTDIMYPTTDCTQELKQKYIDSLVYLYSLQQKAELYFEDVGNITKSGKYLNFELTVSNKGIIDAEEVNLTVYTKDKKISSFNLGKINFGESQKFTIKNLKLPSLNIEGISFKITSITDEYIFDNNEILLRT